MIDPGVRIGQGYPRFDGHLEKETQYGFSHPH